MYKILSDEYVHSGEATWKMKPKYRLMSELDEYHICESGDPSLFWTYLDEDFVGLVGKIAYNRGGKRFASTGRTASAGLRSVGSYESEMVEGRIEIKLPLIYNVPNAAVAFPDLLVGIQ